MSQDLRSAAATLSDLALHAGHGNLAGAALAVRAALAATPAPAAQPVAWRVCVEGMWFHARDRDGLVTALGVQLARAIDPGEVQPLYASPTAPATDKESLTVAPAPAAPWQPIETAPKDGTDVLLSNGTAVSVGNWLHVAPYIREHRDLEGRYVGQDEDDGYDGWVDWSGGMLPEPTHWMPLPPPPQA